MKLSRLHLLILACATVLLFLVVKVVETFIRDSRAIETAFQSIGLEGKPLETLPLTIGDLKTLMGLNTWKFQIPARKGFDLTGGTIFAEMPGEEPRRLGGVSSSEKEPILIAMSDLSAQSEKVSITVTAFTGGMFMSTKSSVPNPFYKNADIKSVSTQLRQTAVDEIQLGEVEIASPPDASDVRHSLPEKGRIVLRLSYRDQSTGKLVLKDWMRAKRKTVTAIDHH